MRSFHSTLVDLLGDNTVDYINFIHSNYVLLSVDDLVQFYNEQNHVPSLDTGNV